MHKIYIFGAVLFAPSSALAHDDVLHTASMWYQEPMTIIATLVTMVALGVLGYGLIAKKNHLVTVSSIALVTVAVAGLVWFSPSGDTHEARLAVADFGTGHSVTVYKSPNCGCCTGHAKALEEAGFTVTVQETDNLDAIKQLNNVPTDGASCHTSVIGDYVVEGHVPLEAIEKLLIEKPDISGIGLAGMPVGTPGMPGIKRAPYEIYQLSDEGEMSSYLTL